MYYIHIQMSVYVCARCNGNALWTSQRHRFHSFVVTYKGCRFERDFEVEGINSYFTI